MCMDEEKRVKVGTILEAKDEFPSQENENMFCHPEFVVIEKHEDKQGFLSCLVLPGCEAKSGTEVYLGGGKQIDLAFAIVRIRIDQLDRYNIKGLIKDRALKEIHEKLGKCGPSIERLRERLPRFNE